VEVNRLIIRKVQEGDLEGLLSLYTQLHKHDFVTEIDDTVFSIWQTILNTPYHHVLVAEEDGKLLATCSVTVIPNLTRGAKSYALIENVATDKNHRNRGLAKACLDRAEQIALEAGCFKLTLTTRPANQAAKTLYTKLGYKDDLRQAYVKWLHGEVC
jgi:ribosomal protein S18 acetylase RimI-like enzyme